MDRSLFRVVTAGVALLLIAFGVVLLGPAGFRPEPQSAAAAGFTVDSTADASDTNPGDGVCATAGGACTLRAAIQESNALAGADVITVPAGIYSLSAGLLSLTTDITLNGAGAGTTVVDGAGSSGVFGVSSGSTVEISDLTIRNGYAVAGAGIVNDGTVTLNSMVISGNSAFVGSGIANVATGVITLNNSTVSGNSATGGGGIANSTDGEVTINNSTISGNSASFAPGIYNSGTMTVSNSTVSGNSATSSVGGISNEQGGVLTINSSTVSDNTFAGVDRFDGVVTLKNTIVANNTVSDCTGVITSAGYNLDSDGSCGLASTGDISNTDPLLGPLAGNGGPTLTHALLTGSPAIDAGSSDCPPPTADQRGAARPSAACDIGAFELCPACPLPTTPPTATHTPTPTNTPTPTRTPTPTPCSTEGCAPPTGDFTVDSTADGADASPGNGVCATVGGTCTLRAAIQEANALVGANSIVIPAGIHTLSIPGIYEDTSGTGDLDITSDITIIGAGEAATTVDGGGLDRVFEIMAGANVELSGLTIRNGAAGSAGGIYNRGTLTLTNSTVRDNTVPTGGGGGGISNRGTLTLNNSTVSGNAVLGGDGAGGIRNIGTLTLNNSTVSGNRNIGFGSSGGGGGIGNTSRLFGGTTVLTLNNSTVSYNRKEEGVYGGGGIGMSGGVTLFLNNSTVSGNTKISPNGDIGGGGIYLHGNNPGSKAVISNSTVTGNTFITPDNANGGGIFARSGGNYTVSLENTIVANNSGGDCSLAITSLGHNLDSDGSCGLAETGDISSADPLLGPLAGNGGPTLTHALLSGSLAIDAGSSDCPPPATDQRGETRPFDGDGDTVATCDIGAFEWCPASDCPLPTTPPTPVPLTATPTPTPEPDTDGDGCSDLREQGPDEMLGGLRNPLNPNDYYDVNGDQVIDLSNDIFGVILHYAPSGTEANYDVRFDRGPSSGPNAWNMTTPDGTIDLSIDILGVIQQYGHDCG